ncbi:hypothetical protein ACFV7Q_12075 [Streptomyces sp. NPDC059851]|uniref:hypothetical protein n=1 Tax=Streptomyces sp. NPDC059851 TaxID=3346971 RepID=UPI00364F7B0F
MSQPVSYSGWRSETTGFLGCLSGPGFTIAVRHRIPAATRRKLFVSEQLGVVHDPVAGTYSAIWTSGHVSADAPDAAVPVRELAATGQGAGSAAVAFARDLIASCKPCIQIAQDTRLLDMTREAIGPTDTECGLIGSWGAGQRGRVLWKVGRGGGSHAVQLVLSRTGERPFETDEKMVI